MSTSSIAPQISKPSLLHSKNSDWVVLKDHIPKLSSGEQNLPAIKVQGISYSLNGTGKEDTIPAVVPGTILNTLLRDKTWLKENLINQEKLIADGKNIDTEFFDPFFDTNQQHIPDAFDAKVEFYTYWYYTEFRLEDLNTDQRFCLNLRGINYTTDVFLNGKQLKDEETQEPHLQGMFLRLSFDITDCPNKDGIYRLAIRIVPPDSPGQPTLNNNGGIQGANNIGESITMRHTVGWDWTISIPDRSTGIWDQVSISTTKALQLKHPKVVTKVKGTTASVTIQVHVYNPTSIEQTGFISYDLEGRTHQLAVKVGAGETTELVAFPLIVIENARLWWPNGADPANPRNKPELYSLDLYASLTTSLDSDSLSDQHSLRVGMREFRSEMALVSTPPDTSAPFPNPLNPAPQEPTQKRKSRQFFVNDVPIMIRGGNWMGMDTLFRYDANRYKNEVRLHKEMNLNLIRVWGGGLIERPEFYEACDEMGIMVMQEFWFSSEFIYSEPGYPQAFNIPMPDSYKKLFEKCATDSIKMLRNYTSLLFWSAANESEPPHSLLVKLESYIGEDGIYDDRLLIPNSLCISEENRTDGPYGILKLNNYFNWLPGNFTNSFNPEIGSLGIPPVESIRKMIRAANIATPPPEFAQFKATHPNLPVVNESWKQLKYSQYFIDYNVGNKTKNFDDQLYTYGSPNNTESYTEQAQLTNYVHYKLLWEGYLTYMWKWYTGLIIWKSQGSWAGARAKLYDWFLEQNGGYWGVKSACEPVNVQLDLKKYPTSSIFPVNAVNHTPQEFKNLQLSWNVYGLKSSVSSGKVSVKTKDGTNTVHSFSTLGIGELDFTKTLSELDSDVYFVVLQLESENGIISNNLYWLSKTEKFEEIGTYTTTQLTATAKGEKGADGNYSLQTSFNNTSDQLSFWNRLQVRKPAKNGEIGDRVLPVFYGKNYFSVLGKDQETIQIEFQCDLQDGEPELWLKGWNKEWVQIPIEWKD